MIDDIIEHYHEEQFLKADGFDDAIIGVDETEMRLIYSMEHFTYNVSGSYVGDKTPIWCWDNF